MTTTKDNLFNQRDRERRERAIDACLRSLGLPTNLDSNRVAVGLAYETGYSWGVNDAAIEAAARNPIY